MGSKDRMEREKQNKQNLILATAKEIILNEGIEKLSIRKLTDKMEYSPAIVYHYFKNKDVIIQKIMENEYGEIIDALMLASDLANDPIDNLKNCLQAYINQALKNNVAYKYVMLQTEATILAHTAVLSIPTVIDRPALRLLHDNLALLYSDQYLSEQEMETKAQIIWTSTFGLIMRIIIEDNVPPQKINNLIETHISFVINSILYDRKKGVK